MNIQYIIDRFEDERVVLKDSENNMIIWPRDQLPEGCTKGTVLNFYVTNNQSSTQEQKGDAKEILNEILNNKE